LVENLTFAENGGCTKDRRNMAASTAAWCLKYIMVLQKCPHVINKTFKNSHVTENIQVAVKVIELLVIILCKYKA